MRISKIALTAVVSLTICGCSTGSVSSTAPGAPSIAVTNERLHEAIVAEAQKDDHTVIDGWYFGQEPRIFKSAYHKLPPNTKADFAIAYQQWLTSSGQNMLADWQSYIPYSKRSQYARQWFMERDKDFALETAKMKVLWIHEALLDGGELWWRANEQLSQGRIQSPATLAHDAEQKLVFKYAESEGNESTMSAQPML